MKYKGHFLAVLVIAALIYFPYGSVDQESTSDSEINSDMTSSASVIEASSKQNKAGLKYLGMALSNPQCSWHMQAVKLRAINDSTQGKTGLDPKRYNTVYKHYYFESSSFNWKKHIERYPDDVVLENNFVSSNLVIKGFVVLTNRESK